MLGGGTGKSHLATALGVSGSTGHRNRVRLHSTVDLVNLLEREKVQGRSGRIANSLLRVDLVIVDGLGYLHRRQHPCPGGLATCLAGRICGVISARLTHRFCPSSRTQRILL
ncbi:MAG TPA: ATP-binding protein [Nevskiaceae bacterium]|nr:ATP-binding protein [Nevskiaceae bacterium]